MVYISFSMICVFDIDGANGYFFKLLVSWSIHDISTKWIEGHGEKCLESIDFERKKNLRK